MPDLIILNSLKLISHKILQCEQDFSFIQILCEINFCVSRSAKNAIFANLGAVNFVNLVNISLQKVQKSRTLKFRASKCVKMADFALQESLKLISRKI